MKKINNIDDYIAEFPLETQKLLLQIRKTVNEAAPTAVEKISYAMPTLFLNGNLVHYAGYKNHIGFYPAPSGLKAFEKDVSRYKNSKGAVQFPIDKPLPLALIKKIVKYRVKENMATSESGFLSLISAPARRAMESKGIKNLKQLSGYTSKEIVNLHGIGKTTIPILISALRKEGLSFKK